MILVKLKCDGPGCYRTSDAELLVGTCQAKPLVDTWIAYFNWWHFCSADCLKRHQESIANGQAPERSP